MVMFVHAPGMSDRCLGYPIVHGKLSLLLQQQDARGRELLCQRTDFEDRVRLDGHIQLQIRQSVGGSLDFPAILDYGEGNARNPMGLHLLLHQIVNRIRVRNPQERAEDEKQPTPLNQSGSPGNRCWLNTAHQLFHGAGRNFFKSSARNFTTSLNRATFSGLRSIKV